MVVACDSRNSMTNDGVGLGDPRCQLEAAGHQLVVTHDLGSQSGDVCCRSIDRPAREAEVRRTTYPDELGQPGRRPAARIDADPDVSVGEGRAFRGDDEVAREGDLEATRKRPAR